MTGQLEHKVIVPAALPEENPVSYGERLGSWYAEHSDEQHRRQLGIYFTPAVVAQYMGRLCRSGAGHFVRILDPAAGTGVLGCAACMALADSAKAPRHIELVCCEIDEGLKPLLEAALSHLRRWLATRRIRFRFRIDPWDFLLANAGALENGLLTPEIPKFDAVICNPPYFKLAKSDPRARACSSVVHGQPNIYGLFMAVGAALIREGGRFVFITPRSYASGPYFQRFREVFFRLIRPTDVHVFESRTDAFADVLQEAVITAGTRLTGWERRGGGLRIRLTSSTGSSDIRSAATRTLPLSAVLRGDCSHRLLYFPANSEHDRIQGVVSKWPGSLHEYGWEVSTGPVVAFRALRFLRDKPDRNTVPLLWLQNVAPMQVRWPVHGRKPQYLLACGESKTLVVPNRNYVLLRRFSAKEENRRLTATPYFSRFFRSDTIGFENHLNFVHKPAGQLNASEAIGLAALLNSRMFDMYFRISSGNTQVSATELRAMRLPSLDVIRRIGTRVRAGGDDPEKIVSEEAAHGG